jgi:hypothetical protein
MNNELLNEIYRLQELSGIKINKVLVESNLILEQSLAKLVSGVERMLDREAIQYAERVLPRSTERIEIRVEQYITQRLATAAGKTEIRNLIKGLARNSPTFADKFVNANKDTFNKIAAARGDDSAEKIIKASFGDEIFTAWEKTRTTTPTPPATTGAIFDINNWGNLITLSEDEIKQLLNLKIWDKIVLKFESLFKPTKERLKSIQQLAYNIQTTTDTDLQAQLTSKLKEELEWLYKKNTNNFVAMKGYFDEIAKTNRNWSTIWSKIKSNSNGGWDFYKSFGSLAQYLKPFKRIWGGITSDLEVLYEVEKKFFSKAINKIAKKELIKLEELKGSFWKNVATGSRRGFPNMSNQRYEKIIQLYGPTGAKASYFRDLVINALKWNIYTVFFLTLRNKLADSIYKNDIKKCADSGDVNSKECSVFEGDFGRKMAEWATQYRKTPGGNANFWKNFFNDVFSFETNFPNVINENEFYKKILNISTLDPGLIGEIVKGIDDLFTLGDSSTEDPLEFLDEYIKLGQENTKKAEDRLEEVIDNSDDVIDNTRNAADSANARATEIIQTYSSQKFYEEYPCYEGALDSNYNSDEYVKGVKIISPTKISIKPKNTNEKYEATLNISDKNWYFSDGTKLTCN